jgi:hypothetical protein
MADVLGARVEVVRRIEVHGRRPIISSRRDTPELARSASSSDDGDEIEPIDPDVRVRVPVPTKPPPPTSSLPSDVPKPVSSTEILKSAQQRARLKRERRDMNRQQRAMAEVAAAARAVEALELAADTTSKVSEVVASEATVTVPVPVAAVRQQSSPPLPVSGRRRNKSNAQPAVLAAEDDEGESRYVVEALVTLDTPDRRGSGDEDDGTSTGVAFLDFEGFGM